MTITSTATDRRPQLSRHFMFRWEASQDAYILLYPEGLIKLNPSAGEILKRCDGEHTVAELIAELQVAFPSPADDIDQGVRAFLDVATDKGWLHA